MNDTDMQLLKRAVWTAFQASIPVGMGMLHISTANKQTEDTILDACAFQVKDGGIACYTDYVCGRMMKTSFFVKDGTLTLGSHEPRLDYQSWVSQYPSNQSLIDAVYASLKTS